LALILYHLDTASLTYGEREVMCADRPHIARALMARRLWIGGHYVPVAQMSGAPTTDNFNKLFANQSSDIASTTWRASQNGDLIEEIEAGGRVIRRVVKDSFDWVDVPGEYA
jgi:hypothetical protein